MFVTIRFIITTFVEILDASRNPTSPSRNDAQRNCVDQGSGHLEVSCAIFELSRAILEPSLVILGALTLPPPPRPRERGWGGVNPSPRHRHGKEGFWQREDKGRWDFWFGPFENVAKPGIGVDIP
eukprot:2620891-Pyramimonas_sp.AAC.1